MYRILTLSIFFCISAIAWSQEIWENKNYIYSYGGSFDDYENPGLLFRFEKRLESSENYGLQHNNFRRDILNPVPDGRLDNHLQQAWGDYGYSISNVQIGDYKIIKDELYTYVLAHGTKFLVLASKNGEVCVLTDIKTGMSYWGAEENSPYAKLSADSTRAPSINTYNMWSLKTSSFLSEIIDNKSRNYDGEQPTSGLNTYQLSPWIEGVKGDGIGEWLSFIVEPETPPNGEKLNSVDLVIFNGYIKPEHPEYYYNNNRVKELTVKAGNREMDIALADSPNPQIIKLPKSFMGGELRFTIKSIYKGNKFQDTAISGIVPFYYQ